MAIAKLLSGSTLLGGSLFPAMLGTSLSFMGSQMSARQAEIAGQNAMAAAQYNVQLHRREIDRKLDRIAREIEAVGSTQVAQASASGLSVTSKSFLQIANDTMSQYEREVLTTRNAAAEREQSILFEGRIAQNQAQNQAASARSSGIFNLIGNVGSILGSL